MRFAVTGLVLAVITCSSTLAVGAETQPRTAAAKELTAPSGSDKMSRAQQCKAYEAKRGLTGSARQDFYKSCLASAGPVTETASKDHSAVASHAIPKVERLTDAPPH